MNLLHIDCSPRAESYSRKLSSALVAQLCTVSIDANVVRRDLGHDPIPHASSAYAQALSSPGALATTQSDSALQLSEQLIREIEAADMLVIGTPMNNFTAPSVLKAWVDQILRMGRTIGASPTGEKVGLLQDKPVLVGIASGGFFTGPRAKQPDFLMPYLSAAFECIGLRSVRFFALQGTAFLDRDQLEADHRALIETLDAPMIAGAGIRVDA